MTAKITASSLATMIDCKSFKSTSSRLSHALQLDSTQGAAAVWDRSSLVALNPHQRREYAEALTRLLQSKTGQQLVNTFDCDQSQMKRPPFSCPKPTVRQLYPEQKGFDAAARR